MTSNPHEGRKPHPLFGLPLSGQPIERSGVIFRPYRTGIANTARISDDFRIEVRMTIAGTYRAMVDGDPLPQSFRTQDGAMKTAVLRANPNKPKQVIR